MLQKRKMAVFRKKNRTSLEEICYKVSLCETVGNKVVGHSCLTIHAKMIGGWATPSP